MQGYQQWELLENKNFSKKKKDIQRFFLFYIKMNKSYVIIPKIKIKNMSFVSKEKLEQLTKELENLKTAGRKEIAERLDEAKSFGDLSENAEYHSAREDQGKMEARITELEDIIKNAEILEKHHTDIVEIGAVVVVCKKNCTKKQTFEITGKEDADITEGKIDMDSPLASAMVGKKAGEFFNFKKPNGEVVEYKIVSIK